MAHLIMLMTSVQQNRLARLIFMCCSWTHFVSGESHENHCFQPALFNKIPLVKLTGASSWASYQQETILGCQAHCSKSQVCKYINVKERSDGYFDCDLLEHSKDSSGVTMTSTHGYVHYEVSIPSVFKWTAFEWLITLCLCLSLVKKITFISCRTSIFIKVFL